MTTKKCSICKIDKETNNYHSDKRAKDGLFGYCKSCRRLNDNKYYNKSNKKEKLAKRHKNCRQKLKEFKNGKTCYFCAENESCCLDFHHLNPNNKIRCVSQITTYGWNIIQKEINKCILLCANCHRKLHAGLLSLHSVTDST